MSTNATLTIAAVDAAVIAALAGWNFRSKPAPAPGAPGVDVMLTISIWIVLLECTARGLRHFSWSAFVTRKLCHAGCGLGIMLLDPAVLADRLFVWGVAASSILMTWGMSPIPAFRFSRPRDVGVTAYLGLVSCWFYLRLSPPILAPVFFADPAGAIVGKGAARLLGERNPRWYQQKTLAGSLAVLALIYLTISYPCTTLQRGAISLAAALAEAFGGDYDNLALAAVVLIGWHCVG